MADNLAISQGVGTTVAADDISSVFYQRVKLSLGADGTAVDAVAGAGVVGTGVQRVVLASDDAAVTALQLIDDAIFTDDAAYTPGTSKLLVIGAEADETGADSVDEGDAGALRMSLARGLHANLRNASGTENAYGSGATGVTVPRVILATDDPAVTSLAILDDWDRTDACKVVNTHAVISVTLTLDTGGAYANGDLLADTQAVNAVFRIADGSGVIEAIQLLDEDDQTLYSFDVYFLGVSSSMGTENNAPSPTDAVARDIQGIVAFATTDGRDLANSKIYYRGNLNIPVQAISGTDDLGLAVVIGTGTPTHTASGITMKLWIRQN